MRKNMIAVIAGAMALCIAGAGCGNSQQGSTQTGGAADTAAAAATQAAAEASTGDAQAAPDWRDMDDSYLSGIKADELVDLAEDYDHLKVQVRKPQEVSDEEVEERIRTTLSTSAPLKEVDRKVEEGDTVSIDFVGKLDGAEFEGGSGSYDLVIGSHSFIEGFEEGLIGAKKGDTRDLNLKFPDNYSAADLAGKDVVFTVTINKISEYDVPELNDDYVRSLNLTDAFGNAVTNVEEYRDYVRGNLNEQNESSYHDAVLSACLNQLLDESTFKGEAPSNMLDQYEDSMTRMLQYYALMNYVELKDLMINQYHATEDNYLEMIRDMARSQMQRDIILQAIADRKDLNPKEEEITKEIDEYVESEETISSQDDLARYMKEFLRDELLRNKVYDWMFDHCDVEEPSEEKEDAAEADTASETSSTGETSSAAEENSQEGATDQENSKEAGTDEDKSEEGKTDEDNSGEGSTDEDREEEGESQDRSEETR